jgi:hypothetical protein
VLLTPEWAPADASVQRADQPWKADDSPIVSANSSTESGVLTPLPTSSTAAV